MIRVRSITLDVVLILTYTVQFQLDWFWYYTRPAHPKSPRIKEFPEASFRIRRKDFSPKKPWTTDGVIPGTHLVMTVFGCLIYELNQCATTMNDTNVISCAAMIDVCTAYAHVKDDFQSSLNALPRKQVTMEAERLKRAEEARSATQRTGEDCNANVDIMMSSDDLCDTVVSLIANARDSSSGQAATMRTASTMCALCESPRGESVKVNMILPGML